MSRPANNLLSERRPAWSTMLELLKPVTWFPPMWAFLCGVVSSGSVPEGHWPVVFTGVLLAGPLICGTRPKRKIPSQPISRDSSADIATPDELITPPWPQGKVRTARALTNMPST